jgi:hypothetical protein
MTRIKLEDALRDPAAHFKAPGEVADAAAISREDKIRILEQWRADMIELSRSLSEGMEGPACGETLRQIHLALERLKA